MKKISVYWKIIIISGSILLLLGGLSFLPSFCDWYTLHIYKNVASAYAHITGILPFLLGEILFYLALLFIIVMIFCSLLRIPLRRKEKYVRFHRRLSKSFLMTTVITLLLYMLLWLLPLRTTTLSFGVDPEKKYTYNDLTSLAMQMAENINQLTLDIPRDENGQIIDPENAMDCLYNGMHSLETEFPLYDAYYPPGKLSPSSDIMEWSGVGGFTIPYTSEIWLNRYTEPDRLYFYNLYAHEMAHHLGYYRENEGEFFGILACIRSDCAIVKLCGYYEAYRYLKKQAYLDYLEGYVTKEMYEDFKKKTALLPQAQTDQDYFYNLRTAYYEENVNTAMENSFKESAEKVSETCWDVQEKILEESNYDGVVLLMLRYFLQ